MTLFRKPMSNYIIDERAWRADSKNKYFPVAQPYKEGLVYENWYSDLTSDTLVHIVLKTNFCRRGISFLKITTVMAVGRVTRGFAVIGSIYFSSNIFEKMRVGKWPRNDYQWMGNLMSFFIAFRRKCCIPRSISLSFRFENNPGKDYRNTYFPTTFLNLFCLISSLSKLIVY